MARGTVMPAPVFRGFDNNGVALNGGLLYVYLAGTTTLVDTYSDIGLAVANPNPVVLDSRGEAVVYLEERTYKFVLKDSAGNTIYTRDNVPSTAVGQASGIGEIFTFGGSGSAPVTNTSYPAGATVDKLMAYSGIWRIDSANLPGTYALEVMLQSGDGIITVTAALVNLSDGSPDTPLVTCASTSSTGERVRSSAITFAAAGADKDYGVKVKVSGAAPGGYAWAARIVRTS